MPAHTLTETDLGQFTGSETWYQHWLNKQITYTDGAQHVAEAGGAYWLLDAIVIAQQRLRVWREPFQVWTLTVQQSDRSATLVCSDGNDNRVYGQRIPWTDFPLETVTLWLENDVIYLPGER